MGRTFIPCLFFLLRSRSSVARPDGCSNGRGKRNADGRRAMMRSRIGQRTQSMASRPFTLYGGDCRNTSVEQHEYQKYQTAVNGVNRVLMLDTCREQQRQRGYNGLPFMGKARQGRITSPAKPSSKQWCKMPPSSQQAAFRIFTTLKRGIRKVW